MQTVDYKDFDKIELRAGTIIDVEPFDKAHKPAYKIWVDLGTALGLKKSSAQVTEHYKPEDLIGRQVLCVCNFAPRQIADFMSEILITGFSDEEGSIILASVDRPVPNGTRLH
ncbi:tRNA-binding protein [Algoriphagus sp. C2-6-M1]|uniref:tRNA-binding protein n=1 Tax=Algoriphagus persicinus TaxID=3108754 RepID=UPI002B378BDE|nr:tRNA-binding protein [Algoriphagus sp. C2-6-M1]MEB2778812.1 tRNA-binding protein [Algoriphagus sp. C2-6-M1]